MSAGTIKLTNGSTAVVGTSTTFTTDLKSGDVITTTIGGVFYTLFVDTVTSNTALTLSDTFTGPTTTGAAYVAVPQMTLNRITAALAVQTAEAVRRVLQENANWQTFYSGAGDITVTLPNGTPTGLQISGPSWAKLSGIANTTWIDRGQLAADANLNTMNPSTTEGEWSKSSSTGLTTANGFPAGAGVGTVKVSNGGRYQGQQVHTDYLGNQWVRTLTAAWNGTNGPWSDWINTATNALRSTLATSTTDISTFTTADSYGVVRVAAANGTLALGWPYDGFAGFVRTEQGYGSGAQQTAVSNYGNVFTRYLSGAATWSAWVKQDIQALPNFYVGNADDLLTDGDYPTNSSTSGLPDPALFGLATPPNNCRLVVRTLRSNTSVTQEWTAYGTNAIHNGRKFHREKYSTSAWGAWREVFDENSLNLRMGQGASSGLPVQSAFDWQTFVPVAGAIYLVSVNNVTNAPGGLTFTTGTGLYIKVDGISTSGSRINYTVIPDTAADSNYKIFKVLSVGAAGARTFSVRQVFTNTDIVPVANGGTGGTTQETARSGLGLKDAAILDVGTVAGTVAAGNDSRLSTVGGKTGGNVTSTITLTGAGSEIYCHQSGAQIEGSNTKRQMVHGYINATQYSWMDSYLTPNNMSARIVIINGSNTKTFNFLDSGNGVCDGTWVGGSDIRFKDNIQPVYRALDAVLSWRGVTYVKKDGAAEVGLIAQDVEKDCPEAIINGGRREFSDGTVIEDFKMLNTAGVSAAYHTEAIKALFGLVKLAIDDPEAARAAIAAIESEGLVATQQDDSQQSDEMESNAPDTSTDEENQADTQQ